MPRINSKKKGAKNERVLAKLFQDWSGYEFQRSPASGGLRWNMKSNTVGDIICTDEVHSRRFPFTIETKFYNDINFEHLLLNMKSSDIDKFWLQAQDDGERAKKFPLLFMRYNGMPGQSYFVMCDKVMLKWLPKPENRYFIVGKMNAVILLSDDFFKADYKKELYKQAKSFNRINNGK